MRKVLLLGVNDVRSFLQARTNRMSSFVKLLKDSLV